MGWPIGSEMAGSSARAATRAAVNVDRHDAESPHVRSWGRLEMRRTSCSMANGMEEWPWSELVSRLGCGGVEGARGPSDHGMEEVPSVPWCRAVGISSPLRAAQP